MPKYDEKIRKKKEKNQNGLDLTIYLSCKYKDMTKFGAMIALGRDRLELGVCKHPKTVLYAIENHLTVGRFMCSGEKPYPMWCPLKENK